MQLPQLSMPPQPFEMLPQVAFCAAQVVGVQPHTLAVPAPPQVCGALQTPQLSIPPLVEHELPLAVALHVPRRCGDQFVSFA
jgi:hypothetical protein